MAHSPLQILRHSLGLLIFCTLFMAGRLVAADGRRWMVARRAGSESEVGKVFLYSGKIFEVVAVVGGFVEAVAVMVLTSGLIFDVLTGYGFAE